MKLIRKIIVSIKSRLATNGRRVNSNGGVAIRGKDGADSPDGRGGKGGSARVVGSGYARGGDGGNS